MNYSKNNNDDLNIKSHLDASLDLKGISVSEELINKTLAAIKNAPSVEEEIDKDLGYNKKVILWNKYTRNIAKVAAVVLIVAAGYTMLRNVPKKMADMTAKNDMDYSGSSDAGKDMAQKYSMSAEFDKAEIEESNEIAGIASIDDNAGMENEDNMLMKGASESRMQEFTVSLETAPTASLNIREIFIPEPETIIDLTITDKNANSITLTDKDEILEFYNIMDKYQFTSSTQVDVDKDKNYTIAAKQEEKVQYTMSIGDENIIVEYKIEDTSNQIPYEASDLALLIDDVQMLYDKYK